MYNKPPHSPDAATLRRHAEARLREHHPESDQARTEADTQRLVHELQVHQIELEMQQEALQEAKDEMEAGLEKYSDLYDFAPVGYVTLDRYGTIREANLASASLLGIERSRLIKRRFGVHVSPATLTVFTAFLTRVFASKAKDLCEVTLLNDGQPPVEVRLEAAVAASGRECRVAVLDITASKQAAAEQKRLFTELEAAQSKVKILSGLLPICAYCKRIRDEQGNWGQLELYIHSHSEAHFSHGYCPDCVQKFYPELCKPGTRGAKEISP